MFVGRFVCAMASDNLKYPRHFRTYKVTKNPSANCKIWEAARATTAAPTIFKGIEIVGVGSIPERFIDATIKCNNPAKLVIQEAREVFGNDQPVRILISIGSGHLGIIGLQKPDVFQKLLPSELITALKAMAKDSEDVASELQKRYLKRPDIYNRFSVTHGMDQVSLEEWKQLGVIATHTVAYLEDPLVSNSVDVAVQSLCGLSSPRQNVTLAALGS